MTETNFEIELRKRGRRRLIGAIVLTLFGLLILPFLIKDEPPVINQGLIVNIIAPKIPENALKNEPLTDVLNNTIIPQLPNSPAKDLSTSSVSPAITALANPPADVVVNKKKGGWLQTNALEKGPKVTAALLKLSSEKIKYQENKTTVAGKPKVILTFGEFADSTEVDSAYKKLQPVFGELKRITE